MKRLLIIMIIAVAGCGNHQQDVPDAPGTQLPGWRVWWVHDDLHHVTCWTVGANGISCLADKNFE